MKRVQKVHRDSRDLRTLRVVDEMDQPRTTLTMLEVTTAPDAAAFILRNYPRQDALSILLKREAIAELRRLLDEYYPG